LERTGAPQLTQQDAERTSEGRVAFVLRQSPQPYRLAVPVVIETAQGSERHLVRLDTAEQRHTLEPAARATALRIDPDDRLFRRLEKEEVAPIIRSLIVAPNAVTVIADVEPEVVKAARAIVSHLLEAPGRPAQLDDAMKAKAPLLLIGTTAKVAEALRHAGLPNRPLGDRGTARAWMAPGRDTPLMVVEGEDVNALRQTIATRHYGASSYLVFEGRMVVDRGVWPPTARPLQVEWKD
jgi:aminopeptidase N